MPIRLCTHPRCPEPAAYRGRCTTHAAQREQATHPNKSIYNTKRWLMLRRYRLHLDSLCPCGAIATDVDHVTPIAEGGQPYSLENTQSLCHSCHSKKTRQERTTLAKD